jgi:hypothetical protein
MSDSPTITQQYSFAVGDDSETTDGAIEPAEESVETDLETWGADVDHRERDTRIEQPEASSFGVDDRPEATSSDGGEQGALFADTEDDQQTLTGERAANQCLFESDEQDDRDDDHAEEADTASDEPTDTTTEANPRAVATDGGTVENPNDDDEPDTANRSERSDDEPTDDGEDDPGFAVGARVEDRDADNPNPAVVVARPDEPAYARDIPALDEQSVADVNPDYPASGPVATVAYVDDLDTNFDVWREADPDALADICDGEGVRTYDFPADRLQEATTSDGGRSEDDHTNEQDADDHDEADEIPDEGEDTTFDPDAETVTDAWEGAYISTNWGYGQTNVELGQIVAVSDSGKTVLARLVGAERVGHGRTSKQLRPTANQYGDKFRLHVRSGGDSDPMFRGSYPLGSDGDMDDGPTRRGWFSPFDNDPENSIRATRTGFGH